MNDALKKVELYDFLQTENGLNTVIMEKAANLSGGQRQRLALARAILFNADIYIFDEATSNVDVESEESIMKVIRDIAKEKTVILISHRLYNCVPSDHIYFLKDGIIMEEGNHDKLISLNKEYAKIFNEQSNLESITKGESLNAAI
ncbi:ATP-binding cassette domain-containing protein, partial [Brachyspira hampsonii]